MQQQQGRSLAACDKVDLGARGLDPALFKAGEKSAIGSPISGDCFSACC